MIIAVHIYDVISIFIVLGTIAMFRPERLHNILTFVTKTTIGDEQVKFTYFIEIHIQFLAQIKQAHHFFKIINILII